MDLLKKRRVNTNMLSFLKSIHDALDNESSTEIVAFYTDFFKAFDKVPHFELVQKVANIGVGGCLLEIIIDYLDNRKQFVRIDNTRSENLDVTSGVPQGSLLGPLLFCIFINDLPDVLVFSDPFIFADDLKILAVKKTFWQVQNDLNGIEQWVNENKMKLAMDKCAKLSIRGLSIRGQTQNYELMGTKLESSKVIKDLGIYVSHDLTWKTHIEERLKKANKVLYLLRRNIAPQVRQEIKLGLYRSLILPALLYGSACTNPNRGELQQLEIFQKKVVKWILGQKVMPYPNQLRPLNILPLPMFMQLNDILLLSKLTEDDSFLPMLKQNSEKGRTNELFKLPKTRTEKARNNFFSVHAD